MRRTPLLILLLLAAPALHAQEPHMGFTIDLIGPVGDFSSKTYPAVGTFPIAKDDYDIGLGASFTLSFPMERALAIRMNLNFNSNDGQHFEAGNDYNLRHTMFSAGGDLQIFPGQGAYRHRGFYFLGGVSADFETFDRSFGDPNYDYTSTSRKSRLGGQVGFGHSFGRDAGARFTLEVTYHTTLTDHKVEAGDPPATSFVKAGFGWVF